jgi:hypothetical protein
MPDKQLNTEADSNVLSGDLKTDIKRIQSDFGRCGDLVVSEIIMEKTGVPLAIVYLKSMSDEKA